MGSGELVFFFLLWLAFEREPRESIFGEKKRSLGMCLVKMMIFYQMTRKVKKVECRNGLSVFGRENDENV